MDWVVPESRTTEAGKEDEPSLSLPDLLCAVTEVSLTAKSLMVELDLVG